VRASRLKLAPPFLLNKVSFSNKDNLGVQSFCLFLVSPLKQQRERSPRNELKRLTSDEDNHAKILGLEDKQVLRGTIPRKYTIVSPMSCLLMKPLEVPRGRLPLPGCAPWSNNDNDRESGSWQ
jgi:hypothetical protein